MILIYIDTQLELKHKSRLSLREKWRDGHKFLALDATRVILNPQTETGNSIHHKASRM